MAIIDLGSGTEILTDPDEDLKMQEMMRDMVDSQSKSVPEILMNLIRSGGYKPVPTTGVYDESIQRCCCETYSGCCGYDPRK